MTMDTSLVLASLVAALTAIFVYLHLRVFSYWSSRGIRGPRPWPIFGTNIYYLLGNKLDVDKRWRREFGKTYGLYEGYSPLLRTTDNELIKDVFIKQHSSFTDRNNQFTYEPVQRNWLLWSEGAQWANQRALVSPMFSSVKMRPWLSVMSGCFDRFKEAVSERMASEGRGEDEEQQQQQVSMATLDKTELGCLLLELIGLSFFGLRVDTYTGAAGRASENEFLREARRVSELQAHRFLIWLFLPRYLAKMLTYELVPYDCYKYFDLLTKRIIEERRHRLNPKQVTDLTSGRSSKKAPKDCKDFVQFFLEARLPETYEQVFSEDDDREAHYNDQMKHDQLERVQREQTSRAKLFKNFSDLQIRGHMTFMFVAGFETTAGTLGFCLYELAHKPRVQQVLLDELIAALGGRERAREVAHAGWPKSDSNGSRESGDDLLMGLKHLDAFVSEVMRLYVNIIELNRRVTNPEGAWLDVAGPGRVWLDPGTPVSVAPFVLQRDPEYFEAPDEFRLERFLPENRNKILSCTFMPFGLGPRHCVGMRFALMALKLIVARTLLSYVISPGPKTQAYPPPGYQQNTIFLVPLATDFRLAPRNI